jgi:RNA polymerase sigma factor (sigma-70 family)
MNSPAPLAAEPCDSGKTVDRDARSRSVLGSAEVRRLLEGVVRRKVPPSEVDDLVQTALCEALASERLPDDDEALRRWVLGVARNKIADHHRRAGRRRTVELDEELPDATNKDVQATSTRDLARWADEQVGDDATAQRTLEWMAREGEGETLAHIAAEAELPPEQVRQRVSRLRRWMRERWARELAAAVALVGVVLIVWWRLQGERPVTQPTPVLEAPSARPPERPAGELPSATTPELAPPASAAPSATAPEAAPSASAAPPPAPEKPAPKTPLRPPRPKRLPKEAPPNLPLDKKGLYDQEQRARQLDDSPKRLPARKRFERLNSNVTDFRP